MGGVEAKPAPPTCADTLALPVRTMKRSVSNQLWLRSALGEFRHVLLVS